MSDNWSDGGRDNPQAAVAWLLLCAALGAAVWLGTAVWLALLW
ncbi:hypothetical protein [Caldilinea sp.]|nr:hypothetical protein [Caldilinea sp.]GIV73502.1 MAG: hypothetical protein KatS3mg049_2058 [Caldilinea sp.]